MRGSRKFLRGEWGWGKRRGILTTFLFQSSTYFIEGRTNLLREAIEPNGSNCFLGPMASLVDPLQNVKGNL